MCLDLKENYIFRSADKRLTGAVLLLICTENVSLDKTTLIHPDYTNHARAHARAGMSQNLTWPQPRTRTKSRPGGIIIITRLSLEVTTHRRSRARRDFPDTQTHTRTPSRERAEATRQTSGFSGMTELPAPPSSNSEPRRKNRPVHADPCLARQKCIYFTFKSNF